ncbi:MAG: hypothetical protein HXX11_18655 [Desulfuromonadales bacterium]|nr:hypothetical protein [Desulfuromonadales bacterium]
MTLLRALFGVVVALLLLPVPGYPAALSSAPPISRMRPYAGIGILVLPVPSPGDDQPCGRLSLYDEPAMTRLEGADLTTAPRHEWIFTMDAETLPLIVMARKGEWLRLTYDDAGREGWVKPWQRSAFETWEEFFKGRVVRLLPGLQKRHYQLYGQPGSEPLTDLTPQQLFRVLQLVNDWAQVTDDRNSTGWLRWQDEDGRLLIGLGQGYNAP